MHAFHKTSIFLGFIYVFIYFLYCKQPLDTGHSWLKYLKGKVTNIVWQEKSANGLNAFSPQNQIFSCLEFGKKEQKRLKKNKKPDNPAIQKLTPSNKESVLTSI